MAKLKQWTQQIDRESVGLDKDPAVADISVQRLIDDGLLILFREIRNLMLLSTHGKLSAADARDLRDHVKLLFDMRSMEKDSLSKLSDEELKALVIKAIDEDKIRKS